MNKLYFFRWLTIVFGLIVACFSGCIAATVPHSDTGSYLTENIDPNRYAHLYVATEHKLEFNYKIKPKFVSGEVIVCRVSKLATRVRSYPTVDIVYFIGELKTSDGQIMPFKFHFPEPIEHAVSNGDMILVKIAGWQTVRGAGLKNNEIIVVEWIMNISQEWRFPGANSRVILIR